MNTLHKAFNDPFFRRYVIYFSGSMMVAFINYLFHPILGRLLSPAEFGDVQAFISLIAQTALIFGAFSVVTVNITTNVEDALQRNKVIAELQKIALWIVGFGIVVLLLLTTRLHDFLNFTSYAPLVALVLVWPMSAYSTFRNAYLQGSGRFAEVSIGGVVSSVSKLVFAVGLIVLGFGVGGAIAGIVISNIVLFSFLYIRTRASLKLQMSDTDVHTLEKGSVKNEISYGFLVLFATSVFTFFYTADVLIIKSYFSAEEAGLYSGISAIAKILFFAVGPTAAVLLSSIKLKNSFKENSRVLMKSLGISLLMGCAGIFTFYVFHDMVISLLIGGKYVPFAHYLPKVGLIMLLAGIANVLIFYFLALRRYFLIGLGIVGVAFMVNLFVRGHGTIDAVINNLLGGLFFIIIILFLVYAKDYFNRHSRIQ